MADRKPPATELPSGEGAGVQVEYLVKALDDTTNSYKFLLLKVILERLESYEGKGHLAIDFDSICRRKLVYSWFPSRQFRLDFGKQDMIASVLSEVVDKKGVVAGEAYTDIEQVSQAFEDKADAIARIQPVKDLVRDSIRRLIKPAFSTELKDSGAKSDHAKTKDIPKWSNERFDGNRPPIYRTDNKTEIVIHERWCRYLFDNLKIISGWLDNKWMQNLARKNPNVPGLAHKLWNLPNQRDSIKNQRDGWKAYLENNDLYCIYSQPSSRIDIDTFALDHFLPRSWVGHDQMWNLIPIDPIINSRKKHFLPAKDDIKELASAHFHLLDFAFNNEFPNRSNMLDDYRFGLHVKDAVLKDKEKLHEAYFGTIEPLLLLARRQGFECWPQEARILKRES